jgi:hypothetical protein
VTSEQGNPPEKGEAPDEKTTAERDAVDSSAAEQGTVEAGAAETDASAEAGSTPRPEPEAASPAADSALETPTVDEGATEAMPRDAAADTDIPAAPAADAAPEPEAPPAAPEAPAAAEAPAVPEAPAEPAEPAAPAEPAPAAPSIDEGVTEAMPSSALADSDIPAAPAAAAPEAAPEPPAAPSVDEGATQAMPSAAASSIEVPLPPAAADRAPEQVAPAAPEAPAPMTSGPQFDDDGTQILRLGPSQQASPPAADPYEESTQVLPPQGVSGFNAPAPYAGQPSAGQPSAGQQPVSPSAWPSPPPNPLSSPGAMQSPGAMPNQMQQPGAMPPPPPANPYAQPQSAYQAPPPPAQQPTQSDDTQKLIIGAHNPHSEPPSMVPGYDPAQAGQSQPPMGGQYSQPGMPPGSVPPGQYPPQPAPASGGRKKPLVPILAAVAALVVIAAGVGVYFLLFAAPKFEEGGCVRHTSGDQAEAIDCADAKEGEDYEIVQKVGDGQECADAGRETLTVGEDVYCLTLLGAPDEGEGGAEPTDEATS